MGKHLHDPKQVTPPAIQEGAFDALPLEKKIEAVRKAVIECLLVLSVHGHAGSEQSVTVPFSAAKLIETLRYSNENDDVMGPHFPSQSGRA